MFTDREKQLIEKLKGNEKIFKYNSVEEKAVFEKVGKLNVFVIETFNGQAKESSVHDIFNPGLCYQIKSDFQIPDEFEDIEIKEYTQIINSVIKYRLGIKVENNLFLLHEIVDMPNFVGFISESGWVMICDVAYKIHSGKTVYARLRR